MAALTFDTGALIALEQRRLGMMKVVEVARRRRQPIVVPSNVVAEWWRGGRTQERILRGLTVVELTEVIAKTAGEALKILELDDEERIHAGLTIDATVMATAQVHGPDLYTGDRDDLVRFARSFPDVELHPLA